MAILNGTVYVLKMGTDGAEVQFADQTEGSLSMTMETRDITTKDSSGFRELLGGVRSASLSFSGLVDSTLTSTGDLAFLMDQMVGHNTAANARTSTHVLFGFASPDRPADRRQRPQRKRESEYSTKKYRSDWES